MQPLSASSKKLIGHMPYTLERVRSKAIKKTTKQSLLIILQNIINN
jgi:hypothetical protein